MWSRLKSYLCTGDENTHGPAKGPVPIRPSPRLWRNKLTYSIAAYAYPPHLTPNDPVPWLYLKTQSRASAHFCLFGHDDETFEDVRALDIASRQHRLVCLRLRRCGAVQLEASRWADALHDQEISEDQLQQHLLRSWKHVFGWPPPSATEDGQGTKQPVWVYPVSSFPQGNISSVDSSNQHPAMIRSGMMRGSEHYTGRFRHTTVWRLLCTSTT